MTNLEIEYVKKNIEYFTTTYNIKLSHEDFIHDIDVAAMVTDSSLINVNYQKVYKKYIKIIGIQAFNNYFSYSSYNEVMLSKKRSAYNVFAAYELMMVSILMSSIFDGSKELPIAEIIFAGLNIDRFIEVAVPKELPGSNLDEFKYINKNNDTKIHCDNMLILMHDYKRYVNKEEALLRIAIVYSYLNDVQKRSLNFFNKANIKKVLADVASGLAGELNISSDEARNKLLAIGQEKGNYTKSVLDLADTVRNKLSIIEMRNRLEDNKELLSKRIEAFAIFVDINKYYDDNNDLFLDTALDMKMTSYEDERKEEENND